MFCRNCGKAIEPGKAFCTSCGTRVSGNASADKPGMADRAVAVSMPSAAQERLLFESSGMPKTRMMVTVVDMIVLLIVGIILMVVISNAHYSGVSVSTYGPDGTLLDRGTIGGGQVFTSKGQSMLSTWGKVIILLALAIGAFNFFILNIAKGTSIKVFTRHAEGVTTSASPFTIPFSASRPILVRSGWDKLVISDAGRKYVVGINRSNGKSAAESAAECARIMQEAMRSIREDGL